MKGLLVVMVLIATLVSQGAAQLSFGPEFHFSQYQTTEGGTQVVRLSAPILTRTEVPAFIGSIEVDITAEDLPSDDPRENARFGSDYVANSQNPSSRTFTVTFLSKQANSTENVIVLADDSIAEGTEAFRLRIVAARFFGQAAAIFRAQDGLTNTIADVTIKDDDFVEVSWIITEPIEVREGEGVRLELFAQAFGLYATPIEIGVVCAEVIATGVPPAFPDRDFVVLSGSTLNFTDVETLRSNSSNSLTLLIIDDEIAEPCKSFYCAFQGGSVDRVRGVEPNRVTVQICDDDELIVRWATDVYIFDESQITGTVELVTDSKFEVDQVSIQGFPRQIPDGDPNRFASLVMPGPAGFAFDATIKRVFVRVPHSYFGHRIFGNAQVTQSGRSDALNTINDFVFTPASRSAFETFTIVNDSVLEFDEIFIAKFSFGPEIENTWNARQVEPITAFILIRDDDSVEVNFNENSYTVAESDGQVSVSLRIDGQFFVPVWAIFEISDGTATDPEDYSSAMRYNVTFRQTAFTDGEDPADTALSSSILINITNDSNFEGVEHFQARIVETSDEFRVRIGQDTVNITITDSVTVRYEEESYRVDEEAGYVTLALVLDGEPSVPVSVTVRTLDLLNSSIGDAATASVDYIPRGPFDITFQPRSRRELFNVTIVDDGIPESSEFFNADIVSAGPAGVIIGEPRQPVIEILDTVDVVTVQYEQERYSVEEEDGSVTLALVLDRAVPFNVTVSVNTLDLLNSSVGDAATANVDYTPRGPFNITFPAGSTRQEYTVNIIDDFIPENSEFFNADVDLARPEDASIVAIGSPKRPLIEIQDLRNVVTVQYEQERYSVEEEDGPFTLALVLDRAVPFDVTVSVRTLDLVNSAVGDSATANVDYTPKGPFEITFPAGSTRQEYTVDIIDDFISENSEFFIANVNLARPEDASFVAIGSPKQPLIEIQDLRDALMVMFERDSYSVREDAGSLLYRVIANSTASFDYEVVITGTDGSATCGLDYHEPVDDNSGTDPPVTSCSYSLTMTIPAGSSAGDGVVAIINDTIYEGPENFFLDLSVAPTFEAVGINEGSSLRATVEIEDDDELRVFFDPAVYVVPEGENQVLVLRTDNEFTIPFTIDVRLEDGTAVAPGDYEDRSYQVVSNVTTQTGTLVVHTETDNIIENDEDFTAVLSVPAGLPRVFEGTPSEATVTILDQTTAEVYFDPATYNVTEGQPADIILRLTRDVDPSVTITVMVQTRDGSATDGADYTGGLYTATFSGSSTTSVRVPTLSDDVLEGLEYFTGVIQVPPETTTNYRVTAGSPDTAMVNIMDATIAGVYFDPDVYIVNEGGNVTLILRTNVTVNKRFSVLVNTRDDSANSLADYQGGERRGIFEIGSSVATVEYSTVNDSTREGIESFIAALTVPPEMQAMWIVPGTQDRATVNIIDDEELVCMLVRTMHEMREDMGPLVAMVMCSVPSDEPFTLIVQTSDGTAVDGEDYTGGDYPVIFPTGSTKESFSIPITDDDIFENDETFFLTLVIPQPAQNIGVTRGDPFMATVTIIDDDELRVFFDPAVYSVPERENQVLVLRTDNEFAVPFTIDVTLRNGTAVAPGDYENRSYQVEFNVTTQSGTLVVHTETDNIIENDEDFTAVLSVPAGLPRVFEGTPSEATVTILDQTTAEVYFDPATYNVTEGQPADLILRLTRDVDPSVTITVMVQTRDGSATDGADYTGGLYNATFSGSSTTSVRVPTLPDNVLEGLETFTGVIQVTPETTANYRVTAGSPDTAMVNIMDATIAGVYFDPDVYPVNEGGNVTLILRTNVTVNKRFSVLVNTRDDSANSPADYQGGERRGIFKIGSSVATVEYSTVNDSTREGIESFIAELTVPPEMQAMGIVPGTPDRATVNITDDEDLVCMLVRTMHEVREDMGPLVAMVMCSVPSDEPFTLIVQTSDGTTKDGEDYTGGDYPVIFPTGSTKESFSIPITADDIFENDETFFLTLVIPQPAQNIGVMRGVPFMATVTIIDDDELRVFFDPAVYSVPERENQVLVLRTDNEFAVPFTIDVTLRNGTAVAPGDYEDRSYQVVFNVTTQTGTLVVHTETDNIIENDEDFTAVLSVPAGRPRVFEGTPSEATVTILDQTTAEVYFDPATYNVTERQPADLTLRLTRDVDPSVTITVMVQTRDGSAIDGSDYTGGPFEVTFPAGVNMVSFNVPILDDAIAEYAKLFNLDLDIPAAAVGMGVIRGSPDTATIHVVDDDVEDLQLFIENADYMVKENAGSFVAAVVASRAADFVYTVTVDTSDGTAVGDDDFVSRRYQLVFPAGQSRIKFTVVITDDSQIEATESFQLLLSIPEDLISKGVQVGPNSASTITIMDNDDDTSHDKTAPCPTDKDSVWGIQWLAIAAGSIQSAPCSGEGSSSVDGLAYRRCMTGVPAEWGSVNASACESVAGREVRKKTDEFISSLDKSNGTNRNLTEKERNMFQNISHDLSAVLDPSNERNRSILPQDLKTAVKFVDVVADLGENNGLFREESNETEETIGDILSNVLDERNAPAFEATAQTDSTDPERGKAATPAVSILQSTERVANVIGTTLSKTKPSFTIARPNLAISGQRFSFNKLRTGIVFPGAGIRDTLASFRNRESLPQIHVPQSFLRAAKGIEASLDDDTVEVVNVVMNNMENYLPSDVIKQDKDVEEEPEETFPASRVISSQILGYDGGEVDSNERVEVTFPVNVKSQSLPVPPGKVKQFRCAFFNFKAEEGNQTGGWSYRGVETDVINTTHVRCIASHLTSFAVLVSIVPSVGEPPALDYITYIGCSISLLCLLASIIFYLTLRKELIHKLHNFVHLNLCIALSLGLLFFLTGIQTATANIYACKFMTALLHYFFLATFTWTLCEAILIYILLVKVFGANQRKWIYLYLALGWVLPIPVVVITGGARHDYYLIRASFDQSHPHYNSIKACWLPTENGVIFAFIGPMVAILLVNAVLLTISLVSLARSQCGRVSSRNDEKRQKYIEVGKQLLKTTIILVPLLGFTWIIGLFAVGEEGKAFAYLFVFANVFQGVFIFVLHVLRHEKVYGKIKGKLPNISKLVTAYTGSASSSAKSTHASTSDTRKVSFALESEAIIESGVKKDEDAESIKDGGDQDIKLDVIYEDIQDVEGNEYEEAHAVATTALDMSAVTTGALEETEEKAKGDSTEDLAGQTCAEFTSGEQSGNEPGGVVDNN